MFLAFTEGLGIDDDLMLFIDCREAVIALYGAFAGRHFGTLVIGNITLHLLCSFASPDPWAVAL